MIHYPFCSALLALLILAAPPAAAQTTPQTTPQTITPKGDDATFDVATWNVEWFGAGGGPSDDERQLANVAAVIRQSRIDAWALQEVADVGTFYRLLDSLGAGYGGLLRENTSASVTQRLAFVYRRDVVQIRGFEQMLTPQYDVAFAWRPPLKLDVEVTLPDTTVALSLITVHMKADGDPDSYERRQEAALRLKNRLDFVYPALPIVLLGDFNDELSGSIAGGGRPSPYKVFLDDPADYRFLTETLDRNNLPTWCGNDSACASGSTLDHVLITDELVPAFVPGTAGRYVELLQEIPGYVSNTSDHLPVVARFRFGTVTAVEPGEVPGGLVVEDVYPNPMRERATLRYALGAAARVRVEVYDLLGRRVAVPVDGVRAAGAHEAALDAAAWPEGVYLVRLQAGGQTAVRRVVRLR